MILNSMCDDYENVDQVILPAVSRDGARFGITVDRAEVVSVLTELVGEGLAKGYLLSGPEPAELLGMPPLDEVEEDFRTYFYITEKGMAFHRSNHTWWKKGRALLA